MGSPHRETEREYRTHAHPDEQLLQGLRSTERQGIGGSFNQANLVLGGSADHARPASLTYGSRDCSIRRGEKAELLQHCKLIDDVPVLGKLAVFEAIDVDACNRKTPVGRRNSEEISDMRT